MSRALLLAFFLGLGAGLAAAYMLEQFDDTVRSPEEIERVTGLATLGIIPKVGVDAAAEEELADPRSALSEAYRSLCTALQFTTESGLPKTLVVTSAGPAEGKSITSLAIARHFATHGHEGAAGRCRHAQSVAAQEARLRQRHRPQQLPDGACTPPEAFQATAIANLAFMASGPLPPNAADLLGNARLMSLLSVGLEVFDLIVIDGPPVMGLADAPLLSNAAAATVFVVGAGQARSASCAAP